MQHFFILIFLCKCLVGVVDCHCALIKGKINLQFIQRISSEVTITLLSELVLRSNVVRQIELNRTTAGAIVLPLD